MKNIEFVLHFSPLTSYSDPFSLRQSIHVHENFGGYTRIQEPCGFASNQAAFDLHTRGKSYDKVFPLKSTLVVFTWHSYGVKQDSSLNPYFNIRRKKLKASGIDVPCFHPFFLSNTPLR